MRVAVQPTAKLQAKVSDPDYLLTEDDMPNGLIDLPAVPARGDSIEWPDGRTWSVIRRTWLVNNPAGVPVLVELGHGTELRDQT